MKAQYLEEIVPTISLMIDHFRSPAAAGIGSILALALYQHAIGKNWELLNVNSLGPIKPFVVMFLIKLNNKIVFFLLVEIAQSRPKNNWQT